MVAALRKGSFLNKEEDVCAYKKEERMWQSKQSLSGHQASGNLFPKSGRIWRTIKGSRGYTPIVASVKFICSEA